MSPQQEPTAQPPRRHRVVIIGSGFGGPKRQKKLKRADVDVKLIARTSPVQPLLYQVAAGYLIAPPTQVVLRKQRNVRCCWANITHRPGRAVRLIGNSLQTPDA